MVMVAGADPHTYKLSVKLRETLGDRIEARIRKSPVRLTKSQIVDEALEAYMPDHVEPSIPDW